MTIAVRPTDSLNGVDFFFFFIASLHVCLWIGFGSGVGRSQNCCGNRKLLRVLVQQSLVLQEGVEAATDPFPTDELALRAQAPVDLIRSQPIYLAKANYLPCPCVRMRFVPQGSP